MNDQFDLELRERLSRVASAVPVAPQPLMGAIVAAPVRAGSATRRLAFGSLVPILAVALVGTLLAGIAKVGPFAPGASESPPGATEAPNGPVTATVTDGPFELTIRSAKARYEVGESIEIDAMLTYSGPELSVQISHGIGADLGPLLFGIVEAIPVDGGPVLLGGSYPIICAAPRGVDCPVPMDAACVKSRLQQGGGSPEPFEKHRFDSPNTDAAMAFLADPMLHLPAGTWRPYVIAEFSETKGQPCNDHKMRAEIEIEVVGERPEPTDLATSAGPANLDQDGPFSLELRASKARYAPNEAIDIFGTLVFEGPDESVEVRHDSVGPIMFGIREKVFGEIDVGGISLLMWEMTTLREGVPLVMPFQKSGGILGDHPDEAMLMRWMQDPVFWLPEGTWHLYAVAGGSPVDGASAGSFSLSTEIEIVVDDDPTATPGHPPATEYPHKPVYGGADTGFVVMQLKSERPVYQAGTPVELSLSYWFADGPELIASHFQPEVRFSIEQLGATDPQLLEVLVDSDCQDLGIVTGTERHVAIGPHTMTRFVAEAVPGSFDELFVDGALHLPVGRWRVAAFVTGKFGPCSGDGKPYAIDTSLEIEVVERLE